MWAASSCAPRNLPWQPRHSSLPKAVSIAREFVGARLRREGRDTPCTRERSHTLPAEEIPGLTRADVAPRVVTARGPPFPGERITREEHLVTVRAGAINRALAGKGCPPYATLRRARTRLRISNEGRIVGFATCSRLPP